MQVVREAVWGWRMVRRADSALIEPAFLRWQVVWECSAHSGPCVRRSIARHMGAAHEAHVAQREFPACVRKRLLPYAAARWTSPGLLRTRLIRSFQLRQHVYMPIWRHCVSALVRAEVGSNVVFGRERNRLGVGGDPMAGRQERLVSRGVEA